jgi:hypothetical protein
MCVSAYLFRPGRPREVVSGVGDLRRALGWRPPCLPGLPPMRMNQCLCWVDFPKLARLAGMTLEEPDYKDGTDHYDGWALRCEGVERAAGEGE